MARSSDGLYRDHVAANMSRRQLVRRVKQRLAHRTGVRGRQGRAWLDHYEGRSFRGWNTMCPWCWFASRLSSPSAPGLFPLGRKTPRGKRRIVTTVRTQPPERHFGIPSSLCAWPSRASWPHGYPDAPVSQTAIDGTPGAMPVNTDGRLLFESVVLSMCAGHIGSRCTLARRRNRCRSHNEKAGFPGSARCGSGSDSQIYPPRRFDNQCRSCTADSVEGQRRRQSLRGSTQTKT